MLWHDTFLSNVMNRRMLRSNCKLASCLWPWGANRTVCKDRQSLLWYKYIVFVNIIVFPDEYFSLEWCLTLRIPYTKVMGFLFNGHQFSSMNWSWCFLITYNTSHPSKASWICVCSLFLLQKSGHIKISTWDLRTKCGSLKKMLVYRILGQDDGEIATCR